ncbi:MAG: AAA family ATPase [Chloroflexota bacterium]
MSEAYFQLRQFEKAEPYAIQAQQLAERIHNVPLLLDSYVNLALIYEGLKKDEAAWDHMQKGLQLARQIGDRYHEVSILNNLSFTLSNQNKCAEALEMALQGLEIARKLEFTLTIDLLLRNIVSCCIRLEKFAEAELYLKEHNQVATQLGFEKSLVAHVIIKSELDLAQGRPEDSLAALQSAEANEENIENSYVKIRLYAALAQIHEALGNDEEVARYQALGQAVAGRKEEENVSVNGRYQLHTKLGEGGMGVIYRATDRLTGDTVALKQVHLPENLQVHDSLAPGVSEDELRLALAREFQILAGLRHPHIISVLDYGFDEAKRPYFTMTYLPESQNILEAAKDQPFERKIELIQQLLQALAYLHRRGVLHRDLKPDNVLVADGSVRVLDFGLSASDQLGSDSIGTPLYMAPELFNHEPYSPSSDLYAAGVVLYQLLTGVHPFAPFDHKFLDRVLEEEPDLAAVDERIRPFLHQLLAKTPQDRFATAPEALLALAEALDQPAPPETAAIRESYLQAAKFVGREAEMAQLTAALTQAASGNGSAWLIGGESGVGKSRLIDELRTQALVSGFQVVVGQGVHGSGDLPYQLWVQPVKQLLLSASAVDDQLASVLRQILPVEIETLLGRPIPSAPPLSGQAARQRLYAALAQLIALQPNPVLIVLEDLQWAEVSLAPLPLLLRQVDSRPLLILGTYRNDERPHLPAELPQMNLLMLPRLGQSQMEALTIAILGEAGSTPALLAFLNRETEGNTFFVVEMLRQLAEETGRLQNIGQTVLPDKLLPGTVHEIVQRRINNVPSQGHALLQLAAVAGRELDLPLLLRLAGEAVDVQNWWLPVCAETAVLEVNNNQWRFAHDKIREALLANLAAPRLASYHAQVANGLVALYDEQPAYAATIAFHWQRANQPENEVKYLVRAGDHAIAQYLYHEAAGYYERAAQLISVADTAVSLREKIDLQNKLTRSLLQHDPQRAYTLAEQAYRLTQNSLLAAEPYTYGVAQSLKNKGNALRIQGSPTQSIPILLEAHHHFEALQNLDEAGFTSGKISEAYFQLRQFEKAEPYAIQAQQLAERIHNVPLLLDSYVNLALIYEGL